MECEGARKERRKGRCVVMGGGRMRKEEAVGGVGEGGWEVGGMREGWSERGREEGLAGERQDLQPFAPIHWYYRHTLLTAHHQACTPTSSFHCHPGGTRMGTHTSPSGHHLLQDRLDTPVFDSSQDKITDLPIHIKTHSTPTYLKKEKYEDQARQEDARSWRRGRPPPR